MSKARRREAKDPHAAREARRYANPIASREHIMALVREQVGPLKFEEIGALLGLDAADALEALGKRLQAMVRAGQLVQNRRGGYMLVDEREMQRGRVSAHRDGYGFLLRDEGGEDVYLPPREMRAVLNGDRVLVRITGIDRRGRPEGRIIEVLERAHESIVGRLRREKGVSYVVAEDRRIHQDILIPAGKAHGAKNQQIVIARLIEQPSASSQPIGVVEEVLGERTTPGMEVEIALRSHGIPAEWPEPALGEAQALPERVAARERKGRVDLRALPLVTIDGEDARDFDDAVYAEARGGGWRLLVAIADVASYVRPGTALDEEARNRATSVYFPGRVVPMLPEALSNGLCSLNPRVERLALVCDMHVNRDGLVSRSRFYEAVICSHARLTYTQVNEVLFAGEVSDDNPAAPLRAALLPLREAYQSLWRARTERGALDFDSDEVYFEFDARQRIAAVIPRARNDAHRLIEECMIAANVCAARFLRRQRIGGLFRNHDGPGSDKLADLRTFLGELGLRLGGGTEPQPLDYARLLRRTAERPDAFLIQTVLLRSLARAVYQPRCSGHFGLALEFYAHFTSPIRRYPDLVVHRAIKHILAGAKPAGFLHAGEALEQLGEHCSFAERRAEDATRDAARSLKSEFMLDKIGGTFEGLITGVTPFGLFVELREVRVEGLVHVTALPRDYYHFDAVGHRLEGERSGRLFRLADALQVVVARVDLDEGKIEFTLPEAGREGAGLHRARKRQSRERRKESPPARRRAAAGAKRPGSARRR